MSEPEALYWAYLIRCKNGSLYGGWTNDLPHRLHAHKSGKGGARYTKAFSAQGLAYAQLCGSKSEAMHREAELKRCTKAEKEALCRAWADQNQPRLCLADAGEGPAIRSIYSWYVRHSTATFRYEPHTDGEFAEWYAQAQATGPVLCAKNARGEVMGFACAHPWRGSWAAYQWDVETTVYCAPQFRAFGVGEAVYRPLLRGLAQMGYWNAYAVLADPNPESEAFHARLGFVCEGRNPRCGYKQGRWLGISTWRLALKKGRSAPEPVQPLQEAQRAALLEMPAKPLHNMHKG